MFVFDHEETKINRAVGVSDEMYERVKNIVFFSTFSNYFIKEDLFDDENDVPKSLNTVTGDLEKALKLTSNDMEKDYLLLNFKNYHEMALETIAKYQLLNRLDETEKKKISLIMQMMELKMEEDAKNGEDVPVNPKEMFNKLEIAKKNLYNFEQYFKDVIQ
jgi:hypothetical protein